MNWRKNRVQIWVSFIDKAIKRWEEWMSATCLTALTRKVTRLTILSNMVGSDTLWIYFSSLIFCFGCKSLYTLFYFMRIKQKIWVASWHYPIGFVIILLHTLSMNEYVLDCNRSIQRYKKLLLENTNQVSVSPL